jgi:two-component system, NarL family, response regulator YdfI
MTDGGRGKPPTPVFVVADSALTARVEASLRRDPAVRVVVVDAATLTTLDTSGGRPIVVLAMPTPVTLRVLEQLRALPRPPAVILLAEAPHEAWTSRARRSGVRAVLGRDASAEELSAAVAATRAGLLVLHADALSGTPAASAPPSGESSTLTARELQVLEMMAEGMRNRAIAGRLKISRYTVKFHVASLLAKLGARSRTEAVTLGVRQGLISL